MKPEKKFIKRGSNFAPFIEHSRIPPQAIDVEEVILGAILLEPHCITQVINFLKTEVFYKDIHQKIWKAIEKMNNDDISIDIITVTEQLKKNGDLEIIGGPYYITILTNRVSSSTNIQYHARIIYQKFIQRELIRISSEITKEAYEDSTDVLELLDKAKIAIEQLDISNIGNKVLTMFEVLENTKTDIQERTDETKKSFYKTGNEHFDRVLAIDNKSILLIGSAKGHGKTRFLTYLIRCLFQLHNDVAVCWYLLEDPAIKIIRCFISQDTNLTNNQLQSKNYKLSNKQKKAIQKAHNSFKNYDIEFVENSCKIKTVSNHFKRFCDKREDKFNILIIDNLMLLDDSKKNQTETDDYIAKELAKIRQKTGGLIIPVHHFTKEQEDKSEAKDGFRPRLQHLKGSSRYQDVANQIILINKPEMHKNLMSSYKDNMKKLLKNLFITDVAKNRDGTTDDDRAIIRWWASLAYTKFKEIK